MVFLRRGLQTTCGCIGSALVQISAVSVSRLLKRELHAGCWLFTWALLLNLCRYDTAVLGGVEVQRPVIRHNVDGMQVSAIAGPRTTVTAN